MTSKQWFVVGISGTTCSGKSTLASRIHENFPRSVIVRQDDYFLPPDDPRHVRVEELNHMNWELITSLDMQKMHLDVAKILESHGDDATDTRNMILILDGFLLFRHEAIANLCDRKYFLTLTKEQCWKRRKDRTYEPPDVPGYFDKVVWPEYVKYRNEVASNVLRETVKNLTFLDGSKRIEDIYNIVSKEIDQLLS